MPRGYVVYTDLPALKEYPRWGIVDLDGVFSRLCVT
jgi:hypothetical protein